MNNVIIALTGTLLKTLTLEILNFSKIYVLGHHMTGSASICAKIVAKICTLILPIFWSQPEVFED